MAYFIDLFCPETYEAFARSSRDISGFRLRHKNVAEKIKPGDVFVCYLTRLSRGSDCLRSSKARSSTTPLFSQENDPFVVRFRVQPRAWLDIDKGIPIHTDAVWTGLSFTRGLENGSLAWTGKVRACIAIVWRNQLARREIAFGRYSVLDNIVNLAKL